MITRNYHTSNNKYVAALFICMLCAFAFFTNSAVAQTSNPTNKSTITKEIQSLITSSDSIGKIEELILDTFEKKKDTVL